MTENSQKTQPIKTETREKTQPIKTKPETLVPPQADQTTEQIQPEATVSIPGAPDWLIAFASQEGSSPSPMIAEEDTREIKVSPVLEPSLLEEDTQPMQTDPASGTVAAAWASEVFPSNATEQKQDSASSQETIEPSKVETIPIQESQFREAFTSALEAQQYTQTLQLLEHHAHDAAIRVEALRILRSRLTLHLSSRPLWEIYASLNAQENQPLLADKAQQTANYLSQLEEK
jgi:hypothetical protein